MFRAVILFSVLTLVALAFPDFRIVGGRIASKNQLPYQVSIEFLGEHHCGGAVLTPNLIITAAHCTHDFLPRFLTVRAGSLNRENGGQKIKVKDFLNHPNFHKKRLDYDVSIIQLMQPLELNESVRPIKLPRNGEPEPTGALAVISGWGRTEEKGRLSDILRYAQVPILKRDVCESHVAGFTDRMICAGDLNVGGVDACNLDSGGPMVVEGKLVGIVSWGVGCARPNSPGVYTYVAGLRNWIDTTVAKLS